MLVHLSLDNIKSQFELKFIDDEYPEEPEVEEEKRRKKYSKFDLPRWEDVE